MCQLRSEEDLIFPADKCGDVCCQSKYYKAVIPTAQASCNQDSCVATWDGNNHFSTKIITESSINPKRRSYTLCQKRVLGGQASLIDLGDAGSSFGWRKHFLFLPLMSSSCSAWTLSDFPDDNIVTLVAKVTAMEEAGQRPDTVSGTNCQFVERNPVARWFIVFPHAGSQGPH